MLLSFAVLTAGMIPPIARQPERSQEVNRASHADSEADPVGESESSGEVGGLTADLRRLWQSELAEYGLTAAPPADWLTVCRRLSLALVGTGVSLEEIRQLESLPVGRRVATHREKLLGSTRFHDYWSERYARFLVGADEGPFLVYRRRRFRSWLSERLAANTPYDELVRELVTAEGLWTDQPAVNFYTVTFDSGDGAPDPVRLAARSSRAFLGVRLDCLECHDDFLGNVALGDPIWKGGDGSFRGGTQQDFHRLAAFFSAARPAGLLGLRDETVDYRYQFLGADEAVEVEAAVPFGHQWLPPAGRQPDARQRLATWLTHRENVQTYRAAVVRVWTLLFGQSPAESVDDLPLDLPPSPTIQRLTSEFAADPDLRALIRWITDSPPFRVDSRAPFSVTSKHEALGAAFPIVSLRGEQLAGAIVQASRLKTIDHESSLFFRFELSERRGEFLERFGDQGADEFRNEPTTLTQRLTLLNGGLVRDLSRFEPLLNASAHVAMFAPDDPAAVDALYLSILNRHPRAAELDHFVSRLQEAPGRRDALEDLAWVLLNSSEFAWNH